MSGLPGGWSSVQLGDLTKALTKGTTPTTLGFSYKPSGVRFVKAESLARLKIVPELCAYIGKDAHAALSRSELHAGDVLFSIAGTLGRVGVVTEADCPANTNQALAIIRPADGRLTPFLSRFLSGPFRAALVEEGARGTGLQNLNLAQLSAAQVDVPPLAEQRRIVAKLDVLTARTARARADLDRIPALAARYKQAVLAKAFSGELTASWRRSKGLAAPWPAKLADLVAAPVRNGLSVRGSDEPPGVRALRLSALRGRSVNLNDVRFLPVSEDRASRFLLQEGDILVSRGNGTKTLVGISALVPAVQQPTIFPDTAFRIRLARDRVEPQWLSFIWGAPQVRAQIESVAKTTAGIWKVSQGDLAGIELLLFESAEQVEIVRRINHALAEIDRLVTEAAAARRLLDRLDQAVLAKAFRGELIPQDPADEPASVLLDRIRAERAAAPKSKRGRKAAA